MDASQLKSLPLFADVPDEELAQIAGFAQEVTVDQGRELVREGDFSYEFMAIEEGEAEVTRGGEHVADLGPGDFFGEMGLLEKTLRNATVTAKTPMKLVTLTGWDMKRMERHIPEAIERVRNDARRAPPELRRAMAARIVLFGATGYTGRLAAEAMVERGLKPVLAARSKDKLDALAGELGGGLETATADVADPPSVRALVESGDVLVTTVGPFARFGAPAAAAATTAGAHYIDSTGEPPFIREVFERYGPAADQAGIGMLTAFGYDWVPGNLAGGLALERAGELATRVDVGYFITGSGGVDERRDEGVARGRDLRAGVRAP